MSRTLLYLTLFLAVSAVAWQLTVEESRIQPETHPGLEVYVGEGCIHCHSQYLRPVGVDTALWGSPSDPVAERGRQAPVMFGNRRQGPDLSTAGVRRSREWNRAHLIHPRAVRSGSRMPGYGHLFAGDGERGEALLDYLQTLGTDQAESWWRKAGEWQFNGSFETADAAAGGKLFAQYCAGCHGVSGSGDGVLSARFQPGPRNLSRTAEWLWIKDVDGAARRLELARLIKYGRPGTAMAGTEWLDDAQVAELVRFLETLAQPQ